MPTHPSSPSGDVPDEAKISALLHRQLAEGILALSLCREEAEIFRVALEWAQAIYHAPHWVIGEIAAGDRQVEIKAFTPNLEHHFGRSILGMRFPILGREFSTTLYENHQVAFVGDAPGHPDSVHPEYVSVFKVQSLLGVPLLFEGTVVGAIYATAFLGESALVEDEGAFEALHTLARVTAIALQRLSAKQGLEKALERTRIQSEMFRETATARGEEELVRMLFKWAPKLAPLPCWWFNVYDPETRQSSTKYWTPNLEQVLSREAIEARVGIDENPLVAKTHLDAELVWLEDAQGHPWFPLDAREAFPIRSLVCIPLWDAQQGVGVLCGASLDPDLPVRLDFDQRQALERLGQDAGMVLSRLVAQMHQAGSEQRYRALFDHSIEAVLILDETRYLMANQAACQMLGRPQEEIRGQLPGVFSPEFQADGQRSFDLAMANAAKSLAEGPQCFPWLHLGPNGGLLETEVTLAPFPEGEQNYFQVIVRDMTETNRAKAEKRALEQQLFQSQKMESLGVLAGGIAHDFNNILMGIMGHAGVALEYGNPEAHVRKHLEAIMHSGQRAADLTRQMLAYSGRGHFVIQVVDLSLQVEDLLSLLDVSIPKSVQLELCLDRNQTWISADAAQLQQLIMNLVINGAEAIGEGGGRITLTTSSTLLEPGQLPALIEGAAIEPGPYVLLEITDTGVGMDKETLQRIFEPFFTTKFTGRGLGLSAILGIVRGHRGGLAVDSTPGAGTTFRVYFPPSSIGPPAPVEVAEFDASPHRRAKVLVVDDEPSVRIVAWQILEAGGYEVEEAPDGEAGLEKLELFGPDIALVLLDMTMPRLGGEETFRRMKAMRPGLPVILSSGYSEQEATRNLPQEGLAGFLQKPYRPRDLLDLVRATLGES